MKIRSLVVLLVTLLVLVALIAACGGNDAPATEAAEEPAQVVATFTATAEVATEAPAATAEPAPSTQTLTVAINASFKPFLFVDENQKLAGFDIDLLNAIAEVADVEIGFVNTDFEDVLAGVASGEYDAGMSAITINDTRRERVDFTEPYFTSGEAPVSFFGAGQGLAVPVGSTTITGTESLTAETRVGMKTGTTGEDYVREQTPAEAVGFPEAGPALDALQRGEVDAVVLDRSVVADYIKTNPGTVMIAGGPLTEEAYGIAVTKNRPDLLLLLNATLEELRANGTYQQLVNKWFGMS